MTLCKLGNDRVTRLPPRERVARLSNVCREREHQCSCSNQFHAINQYISKWTLVDTAMRIWLTLRMRANDARRLDHATLEAMRERAVRSVQDGESPAVVADVLGINRSTIYGWLAQYRRTWGR